MKFYYQYPERLSQIPKPDLENANGNIVIFGTEITGGITACALMQNQVPFKVFVDSDIRKHGKNYLGHPIISPQELAKKHDDALVLVASSSFMAIRQALLDLGFSKSKIFPCAHVNEGVELSKCDLPFSEEHLLRSIKRNNTHCFFALNPEQKIIPDFNIAVTSRCSLRCKECSHQVPYWNKQQDGKEIDMINAVEKLIKAGYKIDNVNLYGGEPMMHNSLPNLVKTICNHKCIDTVTIITNSTLPIKDELLSVLISNKDRIIMRLSNYGSLSKYVDDIKDMLHKHSIRFEETIHDKWYHVPLPRNLGLSDEELTDIYLNCSRNSKNTGLLIISDGKFHPCNHSITIDGRGIELPETDYVSLESSKFSDEIKQLHRRDSFFEACRYCTKGTSEEFVSVPVAEQLP